MERIDAGQAEERGWYIAVMPRVVAHLGERKAEKKMELHRQKALLEFGSHPELVRALRDSGEFFLEHFRERDVRYVLITEYDVERSNVATVFVPLDEVQSDYVRDAVARAEEHL